MADPESTKSAWEIGPWVIGVIVTAIGFFGAVFRNEYTTKKVNKTLYDPRTGDLRLVKKDDCESSIYNVLNE